LAKRKNKIITDLLMTGIADKGKAVGRTEDGQVVFADGAVPGDVVDVMVLRKKKSMSEAIVKRIVSYSDDRVTPACRHFGVCGGCKWQNLNYEAQLRHKFQTVKDCISRIAKLNPDIVQPIIGCEHNLQYRNKLEYSFSTRRWITNEEAAEEGEIIQSGAFGFHRPGFFDKIVDIQECLLQDDLTNQIRNFVKQYALDYEYSFYDLRAHNGLLRNMIVRNTTSGDWMVILIFGYNDEDKVISIMEAIKSNFPQITSLNYAINDKVNDTIWDKEVVNYHGVPYIVQNLKEVKYRIGNKSFFQTNPRQAETLFDVAADYAELTQDDNVYDLYTGLGSIALYIASKVKHVTGIEEIKEAIIDANINMELNGITNATFYAGDVKHLLNDDFVTKHGKADVVITDPPRLGMHENVVKTLLELEVPRLIYISCNPATQARDLALLNEKYETTKVQPVDMFPHTHHIESVAQLKLRSLL
jgi:23S rRNA (uracil1939-C5)-methyltransferase